MSHQKNVYVNSLETRPSSRGTRTVKRDIILNLIDTLLSFLNNVEVSDSSAFLNNHAKNQQHGEKCI